MKIGFIVGRTDEEYFDSDNLHQYTPKKYLIDGKYLMVDVAIAMTAKLTYPNITVDIILPKEITALHRLREDVKVLLRDDPEQFKVKHLHTGPGTELKKLLEKFGIHSKANCSCNKRAQYMDYAGNDWVEENMDTVVSWLEEEAKKRKLPFFKAAGKILVKKAIANSKKKQALE